MALVGACAFTIGAAVLQSVQGDLTAQRFRAEQMEDRARLIVLRMGWEFPSGNV